MAAPLAAHRSARSGRGCRGAGSPRSASTGRGGSSAGSRDMAPRRVPATAGRPRRSNSAGTLARVIVSCATVPAALEGPDRRSRTASAPLQARRRRCAGGRRRGPGTRRRSGRRAPRRTPRPRPRSPARAAASDLRQGQPDDPQRVGDPVGVPELAAAASACSVSSSASSTRPPTAGRRRTAAIPKARRRARQRRDLAGQLDVAIEVAAVDLPEGLDEGRVARLARTRSPAAPPARWRDGRARPPPRRADEAGIARRRVQPREPRTSAAAAASSSSSAQPIVSNSSTENPISAAWAAMSVATVQLAALAAPPERRSAGWPARPRTQSTASRQPGPFQRSQRAAASLREVRGMPVAQRPRARSRPAGPRRTAGSSRRGCSGSGAAPWSATTRDLRTSESSRPQHLDLVGRPGDGAERRQVEAAREDRRGPQQRTLVVVEQVVGPRHRVLQRQLPLGPYSGPVSSRKRSPSGPAPRPRSSPPSAPPPARSPAEARRGSRRSRPPPPRSARRRSRSRAVRRRPARRTSVTASDVTPPSSASGEHRHEAPRRRPTGTRRDVARTLGVSERARICADRRRRRGQDVLAVVDHDQQLPAGHRLGDGVDDAGRRPAA